MDINYAAKGTFFPWGGNVYICTDRAAINLQTKLVECIPHVAGLNPKAFRSVDILILLFSVIYLGIQQV